MVQQLVRGTPYYKNCEGIWNSISRTFILGIERSMIDIDIGYDDGPVWLSGFPDPLCAPDHADLCGSDNDDSIP